MFSYSNCFACLIFDYIFSCIIYFSLRMSYKRSFGRLLQVHSICTVNSIQISVAGNFWCCTWLLKIIYYRNFLGLRYAYIVVKHNYNYRIYERNWCHSIILNIIFCRQVTAVQASDVIVTNTMDSDDDLQVQLYVQRMGEVISQQVVIDAVNVSNVN